MTLPISLIGLMSAAAAAAAGCIGSADSVNDELIEFNEVAIATVIEGAELLRLAEVSRPQPLSRYRTGALVSLC